MIPLEVEEWKGEREGDLWVNKSGNVRKQSKTKNSFILFGFKKKLVNKPANKN